LVRTQLDRSIPEVDSEITAPDDRVMAVPSAFAATDYTDQPDCDPAEFRRTLRLTFFGEAMKFRRETETAFDHPIPLKRWASCWRTHSAGGRA
jgi:hypothetical protein